MALLNQVTITEIIFPAIVVAGVLIGAVLVFVFGFKNAEEPQFDKLPILLDDRKASSKKRKTKEKKSASNGQVAHEPEVKAKKATTEATKKSPAKEKKEVEKPKPKEKVVIEKVVVEKKTPTKKEVVPAKKGKQAKPADFDDGDWEKVPSKSDKKVKKSQDEPKSPKKESPSKKESPTRGKKDSPINDKRKPKESKKEEAPVEAVTVKKEEVKPVQMIDKALQDQINELQKALNEMEKRERSSTPVKAPVEAPKAPVSAKTPAAPPSPPPGVAEVKEVKEKKKPEKKVAEEPAPVVQKEKTAKKEKPKLEAPAAATTENEAVFDELGDSWTDAKAPKKGKKKVRKDQ